MTTANPTRKPVLKSGNDKLGNVLTFSLPAITTCPGSSKLCREFCYATSGRFCTPSVRKSLQQSLRRSRQKNFVSRVVGELSRRRPGSLLRLHPSGDFYNVRYTLKWLTIIRQSPHITFWVYTRSWRKPIIARVLRAMAKLPNVFVWFSCDAETGRPAKVPQRVRLAYVMLNDADRPRWQPDLFFRDYPMRRSVAKHVAGTLVCPPENGVSHSVQCQNCQICFSDPALNQQRRTRNRFKEHTVYERRIPLTLLAQ